MVGRMVTVHVIVFMYALSCEMSILILLMLYFIFIFSDFFFYFVVYFYYFFSPLSDLFLLFLLSLTDYKIVPYL